MWWPWSRDEAIEALLRQSIKTSLKVDVIEERTRHMATKEDYNALVVAIDAATDAIAARIQALTDKLLAGGMTAEEEAATKAELDARLERLRSLGKDPADPVPSE